MPAALKHARKPGKAIPVQVIQSPALREIPWLVHGFSTRMGGVSTPPGHRRRRADRGDLNLGKVSWDAPRHVAENRRRLLGSLRAHRMRLLTLRQIHSDMIRSFDSPKGSASAALDSLRGDGCITNRPGLLLSILSADCLPILIADLRQRVVAAFHAGWRGTVRRIAQKGVGRMRLLYGSRPEDLRAAIGPGIGVCCYEVGAEVIEEFESQFVYASSLFRLPPERQRPLEERHSLFFRNAVKGPFFGKKPKAHLDLVKANVAQLLEAGMADENIWAEAPCTHCHAELFFSHRRDLGCAGRMMGVIGIRK